MPEEYKSNSDKSHERDIPGTSERPKVEKVVTGNAKKKKQSFANKMANTFAPGDVDSVKNYIWADVLVPSIKRAISDIVCNGINMILGEPSGSKRNSESRAAKVSYRSYYDDERREPKNRLSQTYDYDDVIFETRADAEEVLYRMEEMLEHFEVVSIADFLEMSGFKPVYTDHKYGWTRSNINGVRVERVRDGYIIRLPRATNL